MRKEAQYFRLLNLLVNMVPEVSLLEDSSNSRRETWSEKSNVIIGDNPASETECFCRKYQ